MAGNESDFPPPGLSICQDLSADEEEDQQVKVKKRASSPTEFGTALMKALKIKDQQEENRKCMSVVASAWLHKSASWLHRRGRTLFVCM